MKKAVNTSSPGQIQSIINQYLHSSAPQGNSKKTVPLIGAETSRVVPIINRPCGGFQASFGNIAPTIFHPIASPSVKRLEPDQRRGRVFPAGRENTGARTSKLKIFNSLYPELPINGIHANPYPWITQNASDRWSKSNHLFTLDHSSLLADFSEKRSSQVNVSPTKWWRRILFDIIKKPGQMPARPLFKKFGLKKKFVATTRLNNKQNKKTVASLEPSMNLKNEWLKNSDSPLYFTEKPSYLKKPSIFFSSFRHLPYFFMSETLSTKDVVFPETNLSWFPCFSTSTASQKSPKNNASTYMDLSVPKYSLFHDNASKQNQKKIVREPWKGYLQHKSFNLKPLSTFIKKTIGYQTSLFSKKILRVAGCHPTASPIWSSLEQRRPGVTRQAKPDVYPDSPVNPGTFRRIGFRPPPPVGRDKPIPPDTGQWSLNKGKFYEKTDLASMQKNTWKIFPPLFQPFTFRFIDLNLPRTCSSELLTQNAHEATTASRAFSHLNAPDPYPQGGKMSVRKRNGGGPKKEGASVFKTIIFTEKLKKQTALEKKWDERWCGTKWNMTQKNFFRFPIPFYFSDYHTISHPIASHILSSLEQRRPGVERLEPDVSLNNQSDLKSTQLMNPNQAPQGLSNLAKPWDQKGWTNKNAGFGESAFSLSDFSNVDEYQQIWNNNQKFEKKNKRQWPVRINFDETLKLQNSKIIVYGEKPLLKNRTTHGPPLKNQKESISLPNYLKNITNQNYQNLGLLSQGSSNLNELYFVFWILFNKTLFIYLSLHYLQKFVSFLGTEYIRNLFKIFVTMKFIDGNILSIIKTFQDFNFQLNQQNVIDIKVNKQLKNIKRN